MSSQFPTFRLTVAARMADYQQRMASQIRREREKRGWRREDLAQRTGASYRQIERWETGGSRPQTANRLALAEAFEMELTELFPDLEAEEEALRHQLERIEKKLDLILAALTKPAKSPAQVAKEAARRKQAQRTAAPTSQTGKKRSGRAA